jgi:hypothetical protein
MVFRSKLARNMDEDERRDLERRIAVYSNSLVKRNTPFAGPVNECNGDFSPTSASLDSGQNNRTRDGSKVGPEANGTATGIVLI